MGVCNIHMLLVGLRKDQPKDFFKRVYVCFVCFVVASSMYVNRESRYNIREKVDTEKREGMIALEVTRWNEKGWPFTLETVR